ncbi:hypothetical protein RHMOL_Rhmol07G0024700 [Rhododendron molle]|uniref:Uncharacterized protein n=1 Tax=Rhododendron molle TaxID=49168 RepID=A0ACC0MY63_RHOML|nr:hypothetical protein RHMOL_Rhmol07G0024700 [Rhododendron molle]
MYPNSSYNINGNSYPTLDQSVDSPPPPPSSLFYNFPSPALPYEDDILLQQHLHDLLLQHPAAEAGTPPEVLTNSVHNDTDSIAQCQSSDKPVPRKKPSKKDRHSKIETAQGPRDRRVRLSLEVAPQFFGLQDVLRFDKASKTVEWLLGNSKKAIKELKKSVPRMTRSSPSDSEGEDGSGIDESSDRQAKIINPKGKASVSVAKEKKTNRALRKFAFDPLAKESREKARARARERTREKRSRVLFNEPNASNSEAINHEGNTSRSWNAFETGNESGRLSRNVNPSLEFEEPSSSINIFGYNPNDTRVSQKNQFTDYQVYGKPWENYSNISPF